MRQLIRNSIQRISEWETKFLILPQLSISCSSELLITALLQISYAITIYQKLSNSAKVYTHWHLMKSWQFPTIKIQIFISVNILWFDYNSNSKITKHNLTSVVVIFNTQVMAFISNRQTVNMYSNNNWRFVKNAHLLRNVLTFKENAKTKKRESFF